MLRNEKNNKTDKIYFKAFFEFLNFFAEMTTIFILSDILKGRSLMSINIKEYEGFGAVCHSINFSWVSILWMAPDSILYEVFKNLLCFTGT